MGSTDSPKEYSTVINRTEFGDQLFKKVVEEGYLEREEVPIDKFKKILTEEKLKKKPQSRKKTHRKSRIKLIIKKLTD